MYFKHVWQMLITNRHRAAAIYGTARSSGDSQKVSYHLHVEWCQLPHANPVWAKTLCKWSIYTSWTRQTCCSFLELLVFNSTPKITQC